MQYVIYNTFNLTYNLHKPNQPFRIWYDQGAGVSKSWSPDIQSWSTAPIKVADMQKLVQQIVTRWHQVSISRAKHYY